MNKDLRDIVVAFTVLIVVIVFAIWSIWGIRIQNDSADAGKARCKSLQGEYGGGKCFKDGKEV